VVSCHICCICPSSYQLLTKLTGTAASSCAAAKAFRPIILSLKVHYRVHYSPTLSHTHPLRILPFHFLKIQFNVTFPFMSRSSKWSFSYRFLYHFAFRVLPLPAACPQLYFHLQYTYEVISRTKLLSSAKVRCKPAEPEEDTRDVKSSKIMYWGGEGGVKGRTQSVVCLVTNVLQTVWCC